MSSSRRAVLAAMVTTTLACCVSGDGAPWSRLVPFSPAGPETAQGGGPSPAVPVHPSPARMAAARRVTRAQIVKRYGHERPHLWGFHPPGVLRRLPTGERVIALTFDACGGPMGSGYDAELIDFLRKREVPATLFINGRWIDANPAVFRRLARDPLFEIADHGTLHRPLSVSGRSAYGIAGTRDAGQVYDEVTGNRARLTRVLGAPPRFFRPGTAYCDEVAVRIVADVGARSAGFTVNGDMGATGSPAQVRDAVAGAGPGAIVLCHMNHPEGGTAEGIAAAVPRLLASRHRFVRLSDQPS